LIILWFAGGILRLTPDQKPDYFLITAFLCVVVDLFITRELFNRTPAALLTLWTRHIFQAETKRRSLDVEFVDYLHRFEAMLRHPLMHALGIVFSIIGVFSTYIVLTALRSGTNPFSNVVLTRFITELRILYLPMSYFVGILAWKVGVIAIFVYHLGNHFSFKIQSNHPDRCGGLKPLGDLCLLVALLLLVPAIYYSVWGFINAFNADPSLNTYALWTLNFRTILFALIVLTFLIFFLPLSSIHNQMVKCKQEIQDELDQLSQVMDNILEELRTQATTVSPQQGEEKLMSMRFIQKVYEENSSVPTWPFDWKTIARFSVAQAFPLLSLVGTSGPVIEVVKSLLKQFGG
jgi:ABC-type multidrug transport system fused ATPase/permease subunit